MSYSIYLGKAIYHYSKTIHSGYSISAKEFHSECAWVNLFFAAESGEI